MPSSRVAISDTLTLSRFDVVCVVEADDMVSHVGLVDPAGEHSAARIPVVDMAPPLRGSANKGVMPAGAQATANLTDDESRKITEFINRHEGEHAETSLNGAQACGFDSRPDHCRAEVRTLVDSDGERHRAVLWIDGDG